MKKSIRSAGAAATVGLALTVALTGCAPPVYPHHSAIAASTPTVTATPTPTPTPRHTKKPLPPLPADALFRITATVTEPGGASAVLVQTVYPPAAMTASDTALLNAQCNYAGGPTWQSNYTAPLALTTTITAKLRHGSPPWSSNDEVAAYFLGSASAFSGDYREAQAPCADGYIDIPGRVHGVSPVDTSYPATGKYGWASQFGLYGFDGGGNAPDSGESTGPGVVTDCVIQESDAAMHASGVVKDWLTQPFSLQSGCLFQGPSPA